MNYYAGMSTMLYVFAWIINRYYKQKQQQQYQHQLSHTGYLI